jgi:hypothetical protein
MSIQASNLDVLSHTFPKPKEELDIATLLEEKPLKGTFRYQIMKQKEEEKAERQKKEMEEELKKIMNNVAGMMQTVNLQEG